MPVKGALQHHLHIASDFLVYMKQLCIFHQSIEVFAFPSDVRFESSLIILYLKSAARSDQITDCSFAIVDWNLMSKGILYDFFPYIKQLLLHSKNFHPMLICSSFHLGLELDINLCRMAGGPLLLWILRQCGSTLLLNRVELGVPDFVWYVDPAP